MRKTTDHALTSSPSSRTQIRDVWADNFVEEISRIRRLLEHYPCISLDTEFPGCPYARPRDNQYERVKENVDQLRLIQLGLTLSAVDGRLPLISTWQFNFPFNLEVDVSEAASIDMLKSAGLDFAAHKSKGIDPTTFGEYMYSSGLMLNPEINWISFHGSYDFAYFLKMVTCEALPETLGEFREKLAVYFPRCCDVKFLLQDSGVVVGSLSKVGDTLGIIRVGSQHQAGSDSLLTSEVYFSLKRDFFGGSIGPRYNNMLYGLEDYAYLAYYYENPVKVARCYYGQQQVWMAKRQIVTEGESGGMKDMPVLNPNAACYYYDNKSPKKRHRLAKAGGKGK